MSDADTFLDSQSQTVRQAIFLISRVAPTSYPVLLLGPTGAGKSLAARLIHNQSRQRDGHFVEISCTTLTAELGRSELFGHKRGSFTGAHADFEGRLAQADRGTLFLDEIGDLDHRLQAMLLEFIDTRAYTSIGSIHTNYLSTRIIAATNVDLKKSIKQGAFRQDLYHRLNTFPIRIPGLTERLEDFHLLILHACEKFEAKNGRRIVLDKSAVDLLALQNWPGNIRQLFDVVTRICILSSGEVASRPDVVAALDLDRNADHISSEKSFVIPSLGGSFREAEKRVITEALDRAGSKRAAARMLGINPHTIAAKMKRYDIPNPPNPHAKAAAVGQT